MTVVITDGRRMVSDGLITDPNGFISSRNVKKVHKTRDGRLVGVAGASYDIEPVFRWFDVGCPDENPPKVADDVFECLVLETDGTARYMGPHFTFVDQDLPSAIGIGGQSAVAAMKAGAAIEDAVRIACEVNTGCGGQIFSETLDVGDTESQGKQG